MARQAPAPTQASAAAALDPSGWQPAWITLALGAVMHPLWRPLMLMLVPGAVDPLSERLAISALCALFIVICLAPRHRAHVLAFSQIAVCVVTVHFFSLLGRNNLAGPYLTLTLAFLGSIQLVFMTLRSTVAYAAYVAALAATVIATSTAAAAQKLLLGLGVLSVEALVITLAARNLAIQNAARVRLEQKIAELESAHAKVRQLEGLLPICMHCGRIRNDGAWEDLQPYIEKNSNAVFSHGLCDHCLHQHHMLEKESA